MVQSRQMLSAIHGIPKCRRPFARLRECLHTPIHTPQEMLRASFRKDLTYAQQLPDFHEVDLFQGTQDLADETSAVIAVQMTAKVIEFLHDAPVHCGMECNKSGHGSISDAT